MSDLYSVITGIQPDQQDIVEAELLATQILSAQFPDIDLREGTGIRDLVIRPSAFLLALCKKGFNYYFSQNTLDNLDDNSDQAIVDGILGNMFLTRNKGTSAVINVRLFFARSKSVSLNSNISFSTDGVLLFYPLLTSTYPASALQYDSYQNEWYLDVDLVAAQTSTDYNISSGSLLYFSNFDPYFLHGEINYLSQVSTNPETNTEFITRAKSAISTRNLINYPSIASNLQQNFNYINKLLTVGAGEASMHRDQVNIVGGPTNTILATTMFETDSGAKMQITLSNHGFIVGELVNIVESGSDPSKVILLGVTISDIVDSNNFKVLLNVSIPNRTFLAPYITLVPGNVWIHQGGCVDVYCGDTLTSELIQFTTDINGKITIPGPVYAIERSTTSGGSSADTIGFFTSYTSSFSGIQTWAGFVPSQPSSPGDGTIHINWKNHPLSIGRMINLQGWPQTNSSLFLTVSNIIDGDNFQVGRNIPYYVPGSGLSPVLYYVYPQYDTGFSNRQNLTIDFGSSYPSGTASFVVYSFDNLDSIQNYLDSSDNRVLTADLLARGFDLYVLNFNLIVYGTTLPASGLAFSIIDPFLKKLSPGQDLILSDLTAQLTSSGGISGLQTPLGINFKYYTKDMLAPKLGTAVDIIIPETASSIFTIGNINITLVNTPTLLSSPPNTPPYNPPTYLY